MKRLFSAFFISSLTIMILSTTTVLACELCDPSELVEATIIEHYFDTDEDAKSFISEKMSYKVQPRFEICDGGNYHMSKYTLTYQYIKTDEYMDKYEVKKCFYCGVESWKWLGTIYY